MKTLNIKNTKAFGFSAMMLFLLLGFFASCKKEPIAGKVSATPTLTVSASEVVLDRAKAAEAAIKLSWTPATVENMNGSLTYFLQWDRKGNNFANASNTKIGRDTLEVNYTQAALNSLFATLPAETATEVEIRIVTATSDGSVAPFYSNVVGLKITTYTQTIPPAYNQLWLVGDATPKGWDIGNATPMVQDGTDPYLFTYTGPLVAGEFKIATAKDFGAAFYRPLSNHPALTETAVLVSSGDPDNKWQITDATAGSYKVTLNLHTNTISIISADAPKAPFDKLWLLGDATPGGWSLDKATPMVVDGTDPFIFTWTGALAVGDFKIATALDFGAAFYRPKTNAPDLSVTDVQLNAGDPDNKWHITEGSTYKITLNLRTNTISIVNTVVSTPPYTQLWIVGDATPNGWDIQNATPLVKSATDPFVFTYTGALAAGEFKIATAKDFGGKFYRPAENHPALTATVVQLSSGDPDNKWQVGASDAGNYKITLNMRDLSISIAKQ